MGRRVCALAGDDERFATVHAMPPSSADGASADESPAVDLIIDFSTDDGARSAAVTAQRTGAALLVGTTGLSAETLDEMGKTAGSVPVMIAPNTSLGVAVLNHLVATAARLLGERFEVDIIERHHRFKRDRPSGTALRLGASIESVRGTPIPLERMASIRSGDIVGEHEVFFAGPAERVVLEHVATDRDVFARGALEAGAWLAGRSPGRYTIEQSLGLDGD